MTHDYVVGASCLALTLLATGYGASRVRAWLAPEWHGALALLADIVLVVAFLIIVPEALGAAGQFHRFAVLAALVVTGLAVGLLAKRRTPTLPQDSDRGRPRLGPAGSVVVGVVVALVVAQWVNLLVPTLRHGTYEVDSLRYHLPFAARFVQTGSLNHLHHVEPDIATTFYPANNELLHALGMLFFRHDTITPYLNLCWLGVTLLAGWCVGREPATKVLTLTGTAVVLSLKVMLEPGSATNDVFALAFFLAAVAIVVNAGGNRRALVVAGAAAGIGIGTKLTLAAPVAALTVIVVVLAARRARAAVAATWAAAMLATGVFWYVRNLAEVGNPLPWFRLGVGELALPSASTPFMHRTDFAVAHYLTSTRFWRGAHADLRLAFGPGWLVLLALVGGGLAFVVLNRRVDRLYRALAGAGLVGGVGYLFLPYSAGGPEGDPWQFSIDLRYLAPVLVLGLVLLPLALASSRRARALLFLAFLGVLVANQVAGGRWGPPWPAGHRGIAVAVGTAVLVAAVAVAALQRLASRRVLAVVTVGGVLGVGLLGWLSGSRYLPDRYRMRTPGINSAFAWAQDVHHARIAVSGYSAQYPFYANDLSNTVQYLGTTGSRGRFTIPRSCSEWSRALQRGRFDYVVVALEGGFQQGAPEMTWARTLRGTEEVLHSGQTLVLRLGPHTADGCSQ